MKKIILLITILLSFFLISNLILQRSNSEENKIQGRVVSEQASLSINLIYFEQQTAGESGNVTFSDPDTNRKIKSIEGLCRDMEVNYTGYGDSFPQDWDEPEPTENEVKKSFIYFELDATNCSKESYKIYFDIFQDALGTIHPNDVLLFVYESGWSDLSTAVVHCASDPIGFYAVTTHFSRFLIGEKTTEASSEESSTSPATGGSGCFYRWECREWNECIVERTQTRICEYTGSCRTPNINPYPTEQECEYIPRNKIPKEEAEEKPKREIPEEKELPEKPELEKLSPFFFKIPLQTWIIIGVVIIFITILVNLYRNKRRKDMKKRKKSLRTRFNFLHFLV